MFNHRFWRRLIMVPAGVLLGSLVLGGVLITNSTATHAAPRTVTQANGGQCSDATLKGTYVFNVTGYQIEGSNRVPIDQAGNEVYDGKGHLSGVVSLSTNGQITRLATYTGTYSVNSHCIATEVDHVGGGSVLHFDEFITHDGNTFTLVETDPGVVISGFETRGTGSKMTAW